MKYNLIEYVEATTMMILRSPSSPLEEWDAEECEPPIPNIFRGVENEIQALLTALEFYFYFICANGGENFSIMGKLDKTTHFSSVNLIFFKNLHCR